MVSEVALCIERRYIMNQSNRIAGYLCTAILVIATLAVYILGLNSIWDKRIFIISLIFVIISELVLCGITIFIKKTIMKIGVITLSVIYWVLTVILAAVFIGFFSDKIMIYTLFNFLLIAVVAIIGIILYRIASHYEGIENNY